tara:strand:+ start:1289 stop:1639 length:351 start_codon:yes stop_codon:yes gene_type:complete
MTKVISNDCWISINLNELAAVRASFIGEEITEDQIDEVASELRVRMTFDSLYEQTDMMVWEILDKPNPNGPHYGEIQPEPGREAWLNQIEKNKKCFEMVDLEGGAWTIKVPRRIKG